jgi:hypothetical protein
MAGSSVAKRATMQDTACEPDIKCIRKTEGLLKSRTTVSTPTVITPTVIAHTVITPTLPSQVPAATEA